MKNNLREKKTPLNQVRWIIQVVSLVDW
jgi:hypothetical protein